MGSVTLPSSWISALPHPGSKASQLSIHTSFTHSLTHSLTHSCTSSHNLFHTLVLTHSSVHVFAFSHEFINSLPDTLLCSLNCHAHFTHTSSSNSCSFVKQLSFKTGWCCSISRGACCCPRRQGVFVPAGQICRKAWSIQALKGRVSTAHGT